MYAALKQSDVQAWDALQILRTASFQPVIVDGPSEPKATEASRKFMENLHPRKCPIIGHFRGNITQNIQKIIVEYEYISMDLLIIPQKFLKNDSTKLVNVWKNDISAALDHAALRVSVGCTTFYPPSFYPPTFYPPSFYPPTFYPYNFLPLRLFTPIYNLQVQHIVRAKFCTKI